MSAADEAELRAMYAALVRARVIKRKARTEENMFDAAVAACVVMMFRDELKQHHLTYTIHRITPESR